MKMGCVVTEGLMETLDGERIYKITEPSLSMAPA